MKRTDLYLFSIFLLGTAACSGGTVAPDPGADAESPGHDDSPDVYAFESRFQEDPDGMPLSSVSYSGQTMRHLLISDLATYIGALPGEIESNAGFDPSTVEEIILSYYQFDSDTLGQNDILLSTDPETLQRVYDDVAIGKDLFGKVAGQDSGGENDHKNWSTEFVGWSDPSVAEAGGDISTPDGLLRAFFATLADNAQLEVDGDPSRDGLATYQTALGQDLQQLTQKFLLGSIAFSQSADDYLDEGLDADNTVSDESEPFSALEHAWDEAFGYFGASRFYLAESDADVAAQVPNDANEDGKIDLLSEYNWGVSVSAAKRDDGSNSGTDFTGDAMRAFLDGRALISHEGSLTEIKQQASLAIIAWEKSIAASAVHYINDTLTDHENLGSAEYNFNDHAKHWSELKGFALSFQFNKNSPLTETQFSTLHELIGDAPVLADADEETRAAYAEALLQAREILKDAYEFSAEDVENW